MYSLQGPRGCHLWFTVEVLWRRRSGLDRADGDSVFSPYWSNLPLVSLALSRKDFEHRNPPINLLHRGHNLSQDGIYPCQILAQGGHRMTIDDTHGFCLYPCMPLDRWRPCPSIPML